jgi:hypothetical protein
MRSLSTFYRYEIPKIQPANNVTRVVSRKDYGMTLLGNDVLVCGGWEIELDDGMSSCALYNASVNEWTAAATIPPLPVAMDKFPMITLLTRPYVFGGYAAGANTVNTVYTFTTTNSWSTRAPMEQTVYSHTAVVLEINTALVCGGKVDEYFNGRVLSTCYSYAATEDVWSPAAQMITARWRHGTAVYKGLVVAKHDFS